MGGRKPLGPRSAGPTSGLSLRSLPPAGGQWYYSQGCPRPPLRMTQPPPPVLPLRPEGGRPHESHSQRKTVSPGCDDQRIDSLIHPFKADDSMGLYRVVRHHHISVKTFSSPEKTLDPRVVSFTSLGAPGSRALC